MHMGLIWDAAGVRFRVGVPPVRTRALGQRAEARCSTAAVRSLRFWRGFYFTKITTQGHTHIYLPVLDYSAGVTRRARNGLRAPCRNRGGLGPVRSS